MTPGVLCRGMNKGGDGKLALEESSTGLEHRYLVGHEMQPQQTVCHDLQHMPTDDILFENDAVRWQSFGESRR